MKQISYERIYVCSACPFPVSFFFLSFFVLSCFVDHLNSPRESLARCWKCSVIDFCLKIIWCWQLWFYTVKLFSFSVSIWSLCIFYSAAFGVCYPKYPILNKQKHWGSRRFELGLPEEERDWVREKMKLQRIKVKWCDVVYMLNGVVWLWSNLNGVVLVARIWRKLRIDKPAGLRG